MAVQKGLTLNVVTLRHHVYARRFAELDLEGCRLRRRRWKNWVDAALRRPIPRYFGPWQVLSDIEVALYVHGDRMYVKLDTACLPVTEDLRAHVESLDERRRRFTLTIGGTTALDHEYTVPRDPLARFDDTPFCDLTDEDLPTMIARILRDPDEPRETIAIWSRGLTIEG